MPQFAECERVTASPTSPFHVRRLVNGVLFPGGGADTAALCGAEVAWDTRAISLDQVVEGESRQHETFRYCVDCLGRVHELIREVTTA